VTTIVVNAKNCGHPQKLSQVLSQVLHILGTRFPQFFECQHYAFTTKITKFPTFFLTFFPKNTCGE
jgi:hypothetical protein